MDVNKHERLSNITLRHRLKSSEQLIVRKDMGVKKHDDMDVTLHLDTD